MQRQAARGMAGYVLAPHPATTLGEATRLRDGRLLPKQPGGYWPGLEAANGDSLAAELQSSVLRGSEQGTDVGVAAGRVSANLRALTTAKSVNYRSRDSMQTSIDECWDVESMVSTDSTAVEAEETAANLGHTSVSGGVERPRSLLSSRTSNTGYLADRESSCRSG